jgi:uncharacterized phage protein (TIGR02220 family)
MASGKKNYFRHSTNAFEDEKIQNAIALLGYEGYAYYFILLETLAKQCENEYKNPIRIHAQTLRTVWRKQTKSCKKVVEKLEQSGLFVVTKYPQSSNKVVTKCQQSGNKVTTFNESFYEFSIPNLSKYMGKYQTKKSANTPNKKKEKEKKEKEIKIKENVHSDLIAEIVSYLNNATGKKYSPKTDKTIRLINALLNKKYEYKDFTHVIDVKCQEWKNDDKMSQYLRPETLFGSKFESYLNQPKQLTESDIERMLHEL